MARPGKRSWLARMEDELKSVFGPAQVDDPGQPRERSAERMQGVPGDWVVHHGPDGTYLVARPEDR